MEIGQFFKLLISQVLYYTSCYPVYSFTKTKLFGLEVYKTRTPLLENYLNALSTKLDNLLEKNELVKIHVCLGNPILEKITINIHKSPLLTSEEGHYRLMILSLLQSLFGSEESREWQVFFECDHSAPDLVVIPDESCLVEGRLRPVKSVDLDGYRLEIVIQG